VLIRDKKTEKLIAKGSHVMMIGEDRLPILFTEDEVVNK